MRRLVVAVIGWYGGFGIASLSAAAQPITDRDYAIDLYQGAVLGSSRIVGMGGAQVAAAQGSAGMIFNPAAPAVRPATEADPWSWDFHVDWLNPEIGSDFDNNGDTATHVDRTLIFTGGLVGRYRAWALGVTIGFQKRFVDLADTEDQMDVTLLVGHFIVARTWFEERLTVGVGVRSGELTFGRIVGGRGAIKNNLFRLTGSSLEAGAIWRPVDRDVRVGAALALPVSGDRPTVEGCDPTNCAGYVLPERVVVPWEASVGLAWRFAPTRWNRYVNADFRDEKALLLAADLVVTGAVEEGSGVEAFAEKRLQPSGRSVVASVRAGAEYEWIPGWLRVRGGSYWEPSRFEGVSGRLHLTAGVEARVGSFCFWGDRYRVRLALTADAAERYGNGALSIGFWD